MLCFCSHICVSADISASYVLQAEFHGLAAIFCFWIPIVVGEGSKLLLDRTRPSSSLSILHKARSVRAWLTYPALVQSIRRPHGRVGPHANTEMRSSTQDSRTSRP